MLDNSLNIENYIYILFSLHPSSYLDTKWPNFMIIAKLANSLEYPVEDPERNRVDSVFETSACLFFVCLSANLVTFCTIKYYSAVQYSMVT